MLTKDLLEVEKRKPDIRPRYRTVEEYRETAQAVIDCYVPERTRGEIEAAVADLETHDTFKLVRGLSDLIDRRAEFERRSPVPPERLREAVFDRGFVTTDAERRAVLERVGEAFGLPPDQVAANLWADRESEAVLVEAPDVAPAALVREYNLSLTQTLLFDAVELSFSVSDRYQEVFGHLKYLGLMYDVTEDLRVDVTGPASLFKRTRKYGTAMAKLLPTVMQASEWRVSASVETEVGEQTRVYEFDLDSSESHRFPERSAADDEQPFDSAVERDFAARIGPLVDGWTVTREPTILRTGHRVMIPDFSFERDGEAFYLEVVGFWTPEYLAEKLEKVRQVETDHPIVLAVNEDLQCTERDFADANVDEVFFYRDRIPVKPVVDRINEIDRRTTDADLDELGRTGIDVRDDTVVDVEELAREHGVVPEAVEEYLANERQGTISNGRYVPPGVLEELRAAIEAVDGSTLADVNEVLAEYGVAQGILEEIGYEIEYVSLDQSEARIRPVDG